MAAILAAANLPRVDFFSLDVEGSELAVLSTVDFAATAFRLLLVESWNRQCNTPNCPKRDAVRALMARANYSLATQVHVPRSDAFVPAQDSALLGRRRRPERTRSARRPVGPAQQRPTARSNQAPTTWRPRTAPQWPALATEHRPVTV